MLLLSVHIHPRCQQAPLWWCAFLEGKERNLRFSSPKKRELIFAFHYEKDVFSPAFEKLFPS